MKTSCMVFVTVLVGMLATPAGAVDSTEYLSDLQDRFVSANQAWGELGLNVAAHAGGQTAEALKIGTKRYRKGLGHHARGEIAVSLDGEYTSFEAEVGLQPLPASPGSVIFRVLVDGTKAFDSGIMRVDTPARRISVPLKGARELRLLVTDAGDGINSDCANWADARLTRDPAAASKPLDLAFDAAPFARVVTSDPARMDGARASRVQEYKPEDVFLETDLSRGDEGWSLPVSADGQRCIGLNWLERRRIRQVGIEFAAPPGLDRASVSVQCWAGESAWQGHWVPLDGSIEAESDVRWIFRIDTRANPDIRTGTRKIRWVFPKTERMPPARRLLAWSTTPVETGTFELSLERPASGRGSVSLYNGFLDAGEPSLRADWDLAKPLKLKVRYTRAQQWAPDRTVIRVELPDGAFGIAIDDILGNDAVYVRDFGLFATTDPAKVTLAQYQARIKDRRTILQEVRMRPDQTLEGAMKVVHNPKQNQHPTMLSLACDNRKFVAHRNGVVQILLDPTKPGFTPGFQMEPRFGSGKAEVTRRPGSEWLPVSLTTFREGGLTCEQRVLVVPLETESANGLFGWVKQHPVCVSTFTVENTNGKQSATDLVLTFHANASQKDLAEVSAGPGGAIAHRHGVVLASVNLGDAPGVRIETREGAIALHLAMEGGAKLSFDVMIPAWAIPAAESTQLRVQRDWVADVRRHWEQVMAPAAGIQVPDPFLLNVIRASQVHCMMAARNEEDGARIAAWIASINYGPLESEAHSIIRGMDSLGHAEFARRSLDFFLHRYSPAGYLTTGYTLMGTGWNLWTLGEHYERARDAEWLRKAAPRLEKAFGWVARQTASTRRMLPDGTKVPEYGLIPPGVMADWNAFAYYFCFNGYSCAGLRDTARALADAGDDGAAKVAAEADHYQEEILRAWKWTQARMPVYPLRDGTWVPAYPSQLHAPGPTALFFPGEDANRSWCYDVEIGGHHLVPFGIIPATSRDATWMIEHMEDVQFLLEGWFDYPAERNQKDWFNLGGFAKVQPYYCRNAEVLAMRDDVKPFVRTYFNTLCSLLNLENLSFQEHFAGVAAWNKTHETGYFLHQTRMMLVMEHGDELWLAPFVTSNWMKDGMVVAIRNAPTRFGPVSYEIKSAAATGRIEASIEPPTRNAAKAIVLRLRHPDGKRMAGVTVNGKAHADFDAAKETVRLTGVQGRVVVNARYE